MPRIPVRSPLGRQAGYAALATRHTAPSWSPPTAVPDHKWRVNQGDNKHQNCLLYRELSEAEATVAATEVNSG